MSTVENRAQAAGAAGVDFPGWMPPMLVKELRQGLRQRGFVGGLIAAQAVLAIMFLWGFVSDIGDGSSRGMIDGVFWSTVFATLLLLAPLRALGALNAEIDARTMDLLLLTRLDSWRIVWGKWVSLMTQSLLLVVSLLPYAVVRYFFGSVDIVNDLAAMLGMLVTGAVLTAFGLWASGMNRIVRMLMVIGAIMTSLSMMGSFAARSMFRGSGMMTTASGGPLDFWMIVLVCGWLAVCVIGYFLMMAVRWFAPAAENHATGPRLMPLALALPIPFMAWAAWPSLEVAAALVAMWLVTCGVIAAIEMASARELMAIHLRGRAGRFTGALLLPGWPSAARWTAVLLALVAGVWAVVDLVSAEDLKTGRVAWLAALAWAGLVFPALVVSMLRSMSRVSGAMYFIVHALFGVLALLAGSTALSAKAPAFTKALDWLSHAAPTTSFWHAIHELKEPVTTAVAVGQGLGVAATILLMWLLGKTYWMNVRLMRETAGRPAARE